MSKKTVKWLSASSLVLMGAFLWGCSGSESSAEKVISSDEPAYQKNDAAQMWARIDELGIAGYFDSLSQDLGSPVIGGSALVNGRCAAPALAMDDNTRYLDELEILFDEGEQVEGVCGKGLKLQDGQVAPLGVNLIDSMKVGTVEFWFRPNEDFYDKARTLLGNDGARIHFFYKDGELYFQKNHHNLHYYVNGKAKLKDDWNLIAGQWGDGYMSVWLNGKMVARWEHAEGYAPAQRGIPFENLVVIGYKSSCCMEGPGQYAAMTTSGSFDQFRISNIPRYKMADVAEIDISSLDTAAVDTLPKNPVLDDTLVNDTAVFDTVPQCCYDTIPFDTNEKIDTLPPLVPTLWTQLNTYGSRYFVNVDAPVASVAVQKCPSPALVMDDSTLYMDELETIYSEGELVDGVCGKALSLKSGEVAPTGINLIDPMAEGTVEFWFRPGEDFNENARTLLGNDGARVHFFYKEGVLYFQKNLSNRHYFVKGSVELKNDWNHIAGQWGNGKLSLWVNGQELASIDHNEGYEPASRNNPYENLFVMGFKSSCCMEGPGQSSAMTTSGAYDQLRISNVVRYIPEDLSSVVEPDTTITFDAAYTGVIDIIDTLPAIKPIIPRDSL
ncbi:LamG-like jellyroll fold domain-containing protein [Fibrobacter sp.]|uniref:LamG-like jellyroll fold domain-containing protein n=1 Tax=Fibrobacter sp. TaxID=35828 RepID=UPI00386F9DB2